MTIWLSNIFKGQTVAEDKRVIDSNRILEERLAAIEEKKHEEKQRVREDILNRLLDSLEPDEEGNFFLPKDENGQFEIPVDPDGDPLVEVDENGMLIPLGMDEPAMLDEDGESGPNAQEEAERILSEAQEEADSILSQARSEAEVIRMNAEREGREKGFLEGQAQAQSSIKNQQEAMAKEAERLRKEYEDKQASLEKEVLDTVCDIMEKVFPIQFAEEKQIILHLVDGVLSNAENSREFLIHVNEENYAFMSEKKDMLQEKVGSGVVLDIIRDPMLSPESCLIESDGGVYDCGMDTQLKNLIKDLKSLSV